MKARAQLAAGSARIARQRRGQANKPANGLVARYARLAFGDLNTAGLARSRLARPIHHASWRFLVDLTTYKAANSAAVVQFVDPRGASQTCPACGVIAATPLSPPRHACACGCDLDRNVAAVQVSRDRTFEPGHGLRSMSVRFAA
ncbi:zinc ribbon domain-containing protein [Methylobacterium sp. NPDC080182]|uniref:zinc ribbon domain-containing protein n=1 Tax=Methylobacterium sp. NPDC080182 TaxID=3390590 RepID=UPI003D009CC5